MPTNEKRKPFAWAEFAGKLGVVSAVIGAWLALVGWSWAYHWFASFGIGVSSVGLDNRALPMWGLIALSAFWWQSTAAAVIVMLAAITATRARVGQDVMVMLVAFALAGIFASGFWLGRVKAERDHLVLTALDWPETSPIRFEPKSDAGWLARIAEDSGSGCWRLLYSDMDRLYLFRPVSGQPRSSRIVTVVDRSDLSLVRLGPSDIPLCAR